MVDPAKACAKLVVGMVRHVVDACSPQAPWPCVVAVDFPEAPIVDAFAVHLLYAALRVRAPMF